MRLNSKDLHQLVHTLSATERMLFKRFNAGADKNAAYLLLFDQLVKLKEYDEQKLRALLNKKKVAGDIKSLKGYLYEQVMQFLRVNADTKIKSWKIRQIDADAEILLSRGMHRNALELFTEQLDISRTMTNPVREIAALANFIAYGQRTADFPVLQKHETILTERVGVFLNLLEVQNEFRALGVFFGDNYPIRDRQKLKELKKFAAIKLLQQESNMLSPLAYIFYCNFHVYLCYLLSDFESAFNFALKRYEYQKRHSDALINLGGGYDVNSLELLITSAVKSARFSEALRYFKELKERCKNMSNFRTQTLLHVNFSFLNARYDWDGATAVERETAMQFFIAHKSDSSVITVGMMSLAYAFFRNRQYDNTLTLLNHIISEKVSFIQSVQQIEARILAIFTHYELKNYQLISYLVVNTKRYLNQQKKMYPLENALMNGIRHLPEKINEKDMQIALKRLKGNLKELMNDPFERNAMSGFDFTGWIEEKMNR